MKVRKKWYDSLSILTVIFLFNKAIVMRWLGWLGLIGFTLFSLWLLFRFEPSKTVLVTESEQLPDYTLKNFTTLNMTEEGIIKNKLSAEVMVYNKKGDTMLTVPTLVFYKEGQANWFMTAEEGHISADGNEVWLLGHTQLWQPDENQAKRIEILSKNMRIEVDKRYGETQAPSLIRTATTQTEGVGMRIFMTTQQVELLSQVRGHYAR